MNCIRCSASQLWPPRNAFGPFQIASKAIARKQLFHVLGSDFVAVSNRLLSTALPGELNSLCQPKIDGAPQETVRHVNIIPHIFWVADSPIRTGCAMACEQTPMQAACLTPTAHICPWWIAARHAERSRQEGDHHPT